MNFLVIVICLTINYVWLKDFDRFSDAWFFRFRAYVSKQTADLTNHSEHSWILGILAIYAVPLLIVGLLLLMLEGAFFGLLVMLLHVLVLLIAFDRTQPGNLALEFLAMWQAGDWRRSREFLEQEMATDQESLALLDDDQHSLALFFSKQLTYRCFEKMFVMFFWYMATGPLGIVVSYVSYQLRDCRCGDEKGETDRSIAIVIRVLEWLPVRLLMLSFSLAGNFVKCFASLKQMFWEFNMQGNYADILYASARDALEGSPYTEPETGKGSSAAGDRQRVGEEIQALQALLERSQLIWLSVLALITLFGINQ